MTEPCPFCGSKEIQIESPYMDSITGEHLLDYCCKSQKINRDYIKKRYDPSHGEVPTPEEVSKL